MSIRLSFLVFTTLYYCASLKAASPPGDVVGKVVVGYQGWFACAGDGASIGGWWHWAGNWGQTPSDTNKAMKSWPDMRQYVRGYKTDFANLGNGQPAYLFSSVDDQVVRTHFRWLKEYGIDGAALQRFSPFGAEGPDRNTVTLKVKGAAEEYGRKFYIMYDISGWTNFATQMKEDWTNVMLGQMQVTSSPAYAMQNGKPVVCIWGMGFTDRPGDAATCIEVINWFKAQGCYVIGGVPTWWRESKNDSKPDFLPVYSSFDMISPWMVGRVGSVSSSNNYRNWVNNGDIAYCNANGIDYQPCVLPGDLQERQRAHGNLMWHQFANMIQLGAHAIYISMFDEYNEGNQIAPTAENAAMTPVGSGFYPLDEDGTACSWDYYMRLTGDGGRMLKKEIPLTFTRPTQPMLPAQIPAKPTGLQGEAGNMKAKLQWLVSPQAARYIVKRATQSGGPYSVVESNVGLLSYTDTAVTNGVTYYYVVSAANAQGESANSDEVEVTPVLRGLRGQYYNNSNLTNLVITRIDPQIDFNWGTGSPAPNIGSDTYSIRWTGEIQAKYSETYTFYTLSDDGIRVWINNQQIINNWTGHAPTENTGTFAMTAGRKYPIRIEYFEDGGGAQLTLSWSSASQAKQVVPEGQLIPPDIPEVASWSVGDGAQRSMVKDVTVNFTVPVTVQSAAVRLIRRDGSTGIVTAAATNGQNTSFRLTASGASMDGTSLGDGIYDLTFPVNAVRSVKDNEQLQETKTLTFHRLFGDGNGDKTVNDTDQESFRASQGAISSQENYKWYYDYDADQDIDSADSLMLKRRKGTTYTY